MSRGFPRLPNGPKSAQDKALLRAAHAAETRELMAAIGRVAEKKGMHKPITPTQAQREVQRQRAEAKKRGLI